MVVSYYYEVFKIIFEWNFSPAKDLKWQRDEVFSAR